MSHKRHQKSASVDLEHANGRSTMPAERMPTPPGWNQIAAGVFTEIALWFTVLVAIALLALTIFDWRISATLQDRLLEQSTERQSQSISPAVSMSSASSESNRLNGRTVIVAFLCGLLVFVVAWRTAARERGTLSLRYQLDRKGLIVEARHSQLRSLMESYPLGTFVTGKNGAIVYGNAEFLRISGLSPTDLLRINWLNAVLQEDRERTEAAWRDAFASNVGFDLICRMHPKSQQVVWVRIKATPINSNDYLVGYIGIVEDLSLRREQEERVTKLVSELTQSREEFVKSREERIKFGTNNSALQDSKAIESVEIVTKRNTAIYQVGNEINTVAEVINLLASALEDGAVSSTQCDSAILALRRGLRRIQNIAGKVTQISR